MAWALAVMRIRNDELMEAIAEQVILRITEFNSQNLANIAWAFAKISVKHGTLMEAIAHDAVPRTPQFRTQELANMSWSFATCGGGTRHDPLMPGIALEMVA